MSRFLLGFSYEAPGTLHLYTNKVRVDPDKVAKLGKGSVWETKWGTSYPTQWAASNWNCSRKTCIYYFARSSTSQMQCLEKFIGEFLDAVRQIEAPGPADTSVPVPDEEGETDGDALGG